MGRGQQLTRTGLSISGWWRGAGRWRSGLLMSAFGVGVALEFAARLAEELGRGRHGRWTIAPTALSLQLAIVLIQISLHITLSEQMSLA